jgi:uncharacterized membrane protein YhaH (DUF805 family)
MSAALLASSAAGAFIGFIVYVAVIVFEIAALWKVFTKAGHPGWAAIIPFYNVYVILKIVGRPGWWLVLFIIPFVNIVIWIIVAIDLAKSFAKSTGFAIGLIFLDFIFIPILGFGSAEYAGPAAISS